MIHITLPTAFAVAAILFAIVALCFGLEAARLWLKASEVGPDPSFGSGNFTMTGNADANRDRWIGAILGAGIKAGELNARAARLTAVAVVFGAVSAVVSAVGGIIPPGSTPIGP